MLTAGGVSMQRLGAPDGEVVLGVRPERLSPAVDGDSRPAFDLVVGVVEPLGSEVIVHGSLAAEGSAAAQAAAVDGVLRSSRASSPAPRPAPGSVLRLAFDPAAAHVFDAATGEPLTTT